MTEAMTETGMTYAQLTAAFYEAALPETVHGQRREDYENNISSGVLSVWLAGWQDGSKAAGINVDGAGKWTPVDPIELLSHTDDNAENLSEVFYGSMVEGCAQARGTGTDPELAHRAALQYTLGRIYEIGYRDAQKAVGP